MAMTGPFSVAANEAAAVSSMDLIASDLEQCSVFMSQVAGYTAPASVLVGAEATVSRQQQESGRRWHERCEVRVSTRVLAVDVGGVWLVDLRFLNNAIKGFEPVPQFDPLFRFLLQLYVPVTAA